jgi:hypothetical protein
MGELRTAAGYEAFIGKERRNYRAEWHPGEGAFLERNVCKKIAKETSRAHLSVITEGPTEAWRQGGTSLGYIASQRPVSKRGRGP